MNQWQEKGFFYSNEEDRRREFDLAADYFSKNPNANKIRREQWIKMFYLKKNAPQHSYMQFQNGPILAFATKTYQGRTPYIGQGSYGSVKYAMDKNGGLWALKIEATNEKEQVHETAVGQDLGYIKADKETRDTDTYKKPYSKQGKKYYTAMTYLGTPLDRYISNQSTSLSLNQKKKIARQLAFELHQLHSGKKSAAGKSYGHGDIKPANIVVDKRGRARYIDFGSAQEHNVAFAGTDVYLPATTYEKAGFGKTTRWFIPFSERDPTFQRMQNLGLTGTDMFALKRSLYFPEALGIPYRGLFDEEEYAQLSPQIRTLLDTKPPEGLTAKHAPLDLAFALIQDNLNPDLIALTDDNHALKEQICAVYDLLDQLEEWPYGKEETAAEKVRLRTEMMTLLRRSNTPEDVSKLFKKLNKVMQCLQQLEEIQAYSLGTHDKGMMAFVDDYSDKIFLAESDRYKNVDSLPVLSKKLDSAKASANSSDVHFIQKEVSRLYREADHPTFWQLILGFAASAKTKAQSMEAALQEVPVSERGHIKWQSKNPEIRKLLNTSAQIRYGLFTSQKKDVSDEQNHAKTGQAFQNIKHQKPGH